VLETLRKSLPKNIPVIAGIAGLSTAECVALAQRAEKIGCDGLMVLPPYVYRGDWRETAAHFSAVIRATRLSCMLYNNPIAYGTDVSADQMVELAKHKNLHAVKESSGDVRRVTAIRERLGDRLRILAGMDDAILESIPVGATGWIAGLVNAFPGESVDVFEAATAGRWEDARRMYEWFLPLLRLDTVPKFVQLIKLVQQEIGQGSERVRPPRLELVGAERDAALTIIRQRIASRPTASVG
jgi:1-pyrroline-4-hydroxy-2-carboxylate deaminase